ncbi:MAG TPA: hypothetical protein VF598_08200 [Hymenobacter sp.]|jgi:hypothetical protein
MRFDRSLWRTILFSLAVVAIVIGVYQTVLQNDENAVRDNYWLFTFAFSFYMLYWYLGRKDREAAPRVLPVSNKPKTGSTPKIKPRKKR